MPHFIIDCSYGVLSYATEETINTQVHQVALSTDLFDERDIKVRINSFKNYLVGCKKEEFIHVFANIMEGRSQSQKAELSKRMVQRLTNMFPGVPNIAMNVREFEKSTYCNRNML